MLNMKNPHHVLSRIVPQRAPFTPTSRILTELNYVWSKYFILRRLFLLMKTSIHSVGMILFVDKSLGDSSDVVSESSGVGTASDTNSSFPPGATVICIEDYQPASSCGHLTLHHGDVLEGQHYLLPKNKTLAVWVECPWVMCANSCLSLSARHVTTCTDICDIYRYSSHLTVAAAKI